MAFKFDFKRRLGSGNFGEVWLVHELGLDCECALKKIRFDKITNLDNFFFEAQILMKSQHPNVVVVKETGLLDDGSIYVLMEYLKKGSLEDEVRGAYAHLTRAHRIIIDVLRGLEYLHDNGIIHRDIKPANILIDNNTGKISDFGMAIKDIDKINSTSIKKYFYFSHLAPEVNSIEDQSVLSDIYACGVTLYRMVNGDSYLPSISIPEIKKLAKEGKYPPRNKYREFVPRNLRIVINRAMNVNPNKRYKTANEMRRALERIKIDRNWFEVLISNGIKWISSDRNKYIQVSRTIHGKLMNIEVLCGRTRADLRRNKKLCKKDLNKNMAINETKKILQNYTLGKSFTLAGTPNLRH